MNKPIKLPLCAALSAMLVFSGCNGGSSQVEETTQAVTQEVTEAKPIAIATNDSAAGEISYNYVAIKQKAEDITNEFDNIVNEKRFNGTIYMKLGNDFEYISSTGAADGNNHIENSINTCYYTGRVTAQLTAAAIMMLAEEGSLSVDDTIDNFFPDYSDGGKITVKNLLNMTSGIKNYVDNADITDQTFFIHEDISGKIKKDNSAKENNSVIFNWILSAGLEFEPGTSFKYSDSNYFLLGKIIEQASGVSYEDFINERIFKPLGMNSSGFTKNEKLAIGYDGKELSEKLTYSGVGYSAFGLISNISDLLKWTEAMLGNQLITEQSHNEMFTDNDYGFGCGVYVNGKRASVSARNNAYGAMLVYTTDKKEIFISLTNYYYSDSAYVHTLFKQYLTKYSK